GARGEGSPSRAGDGMTEVRSPVPGGRGGEDMRHRGDRLQGAAHQLGHELADTQRSQLLAYLDLIAQCNKSGNRPAGRDAGELLDRVGNLRGGYDVVSCRAFASLADFVSWSGRAIGEQGVWLAMKGKRPDDEIAAVPDSAEVFHVEPLSVPELSAERCIVWLR